ncbi:hypothetical protein [Amphritea sp.]|uniref:hypothetical protein n=1 Tax=Amphritea sp. TaxID=1872502 RepID=UPI003D1392B0
MHILIGIFLVLFLLAVSKTLRTWALIGLVVITGVVVIGLVFVALVDVNDALPVIAVLFLVGIALLVWALIQMGIHLGKAAGGSVDEYLDLENRIKGKKHDESLKSAAGKAVELLVEDAIRADASVWEPSKQPKRDQTGSLQCLPQKIIPITENPRNDDENQLCNFQSVHQSNKRTKRLIWSAPGRKNAAPLSHTSKNSDLKSFYLQHLSFSEKNGCCIKCQRPLYIFQSQNLCASFDELTTDWNTHTCESSPSIAMGELQLFLPLAYPTGVIHGRLQTRSHHEELTINYETATPRFWPSHWSGQPILASNIGNHYQLSTFVIIDDEIVPMLIRGRLLAPNALN